MALRLVIPTVRAVVPPSALVLLAFLSVAGFATAEEQRFAGSASCAGCHQSEYRTWHDSHHGWALREASSESVLGNFADVFFQNGNVTTLFTKLGNEYFVETAGPDGKPTKYQVRYTVGVAPLQQYLVETEGGRLQALDLAWDVERKSWYHLYPREDVAAGNGLHWSGPYKNWQSRCAECHQTGFKKNYDAETKSYASQWSDLTVSCEACHGAASAHVAWARSFKSGVKPPSPFVKLGTGQQANELAVCGPCHARRAAFGADSPPAGSMFGVHYGLALLTDGLYFADGQQEGEVYVLGSFLQSKMKARGVTCSNCHDPHSGRVVAEGNAVCTQCHNQNGREGFPTLTKANYDTPEHHHHKQGTEAAQCVSCHMPDRTYMRVDKRRDHFFRRPDPIQSKAAGSPDVCTGCHTDTTPEWAWAQISTWSPRSDYAWQDRTAFIASRKGDGTREAMDALADYALRLDHPDIVRATALNDLQQGGDGPLVNGLRSLFADPSDLVRAAAAHLVRNLSAPDANELLRPLLSDSVRAVRQAAAAELTADDQATMSAGERPAFDIAMADYRFSQLAMADTPEAHMALAGVALTSRNWQQAEDDFKEATTLDPQLDSARLMLARLRSALGDETGAVAYLEQGISKNPRGVSLLLELAAIDTTYGEDRKAIDWYRRAIGIDPNQPDALAGLAIAALRTGDMGLAVDSSTKLLVLQPNNPQALVISAMVHFVSGDISAARSDAEKALRIDSSTELPRELNELLHSR